VSISARRKSVFESRPPRSKIRQTQRRPIKAAMLRVHPVSVNAAELARRKFLRLAAGAAAVPATSPSTAAQTYPTRPITMIVPFAAGGPTDVAARLVAERMKKFLGQTIVIENVSGADGSIGAGRVARAKPDGYTIEYSSFSAHVLNGGFYSLPYDLLNDFAPIAPLYRAVPLLVGRKTLPAKDLRELIVWLKSNPDKASMAIVFAGARVLAPYLQQQTGTQFALVPYRGTAPAIQDLVAGQVDLLMDFPRTSLPLVRAESIKAYGVISDGRLAAAPDIPTFAEMGVPALSYAEWVGLFAPGGTPRDIVDKLNEAALEVLADPATRARITEFGAEIFPREQQTPRALGALQKAQIEKWWPLIRKFGIKAE
jgi:tripartite-type tricarboxylate transporter receptor subunit TctC